MTATFKVLSALLTYPSAELQQAIPEFAAAIERRGAAAGGQSGASSTLLIDEIADGDLYDLQERYMLLFDRTRSLSLHLFEHVHGESRDRGQAMIDLQDHLREARPRHQRRRAAGFPAAVPGIPVDPAAPRSLRAARPDRAYPRGPRRAAAQAPLGLRGGVPRAGRARGDQAQGRGRLCAARTPDPDADDLAALDAAWEDEPVTFGPGAGNGCKDELIAQGPCRPPPCARVEAAPSRPVRRAPEDTAEEPSCARPSTTSSSAGTPTSA